MVPEMIEQLEVPKMMSQSGIHRRTAEQIVDLPALVFRERISERICEQNGVIEVTKISCRDRNLQRTAEKTLADSVDESISQSMEESLEVDKIVLPEQKQKETRRMQKWRT